MSDLVSVLTNILEKNILYESISNRQNNTMIGYLFRRDELNTEEYPINTTSIKSLLQRTGISAQEMIFGTSSLGAMFEKSGYKAVPSPR